MKGLILKEFLSLKGYMKTIMVILVFYLIFGFVEEENASFVYYIIIFVFGFISITSFSYDEKANWNPYAITLPVTRSQIVLSKYIVSICLIILGIFTSFLYKCIFFIYNKTSITQDILPSYFISLSIGIIFLSVMIPLFFQFGVEKARILLFIIIAIPTFAMSFLSKQNDFLSSWAKIVDYLPYLLLSVALIVVMISYHISVHLFKNKEF